MLGIAFPTEKVIFSFSGRTLLHGDRKKGGGEECVCVCERERERDTAKFFLGGGLFISFHTFRMTENFRPFNA